MNILNLILLFGSAVGLGLIVYFIFKKFLIKTENPAMKFLLTTIFKDMIWVGFWIIYLDYSRTNLLLIVGVFLVTSFLLYFKVIQLLNKS